METITKITVNSTFDSSKPVVGKYFGIDFAGYITDSRQSPCGNNLIFTIKLDSPILLNTNDIRKSIIVSTNDTDCWLGFELAQDDSRELSSERPSNILDSKAKFDKLSINDKESVLFFLQDKFTEDNIRIRIMDDIILFDDLQDCELKERLFDRHEFVDKDILLYILGEL